MILALTLLACASGELALEPPGINWGEVDFHDDACMDCACEDHCDPREISLTNDGDGELNAEIPGGLDPERFCLRGFEDVSDPIVIPTLAPGDTYLLEISICGYQAGEQTLTVAGQIVFETDGIEASVPLEWSYIPVRDQSGDE